MSNSIIINTTQELETFTKQAKSGDCQDVEFVKISNINISVDKIEELSALLPNLKELDYKEPTIDLYGSYTKDDEDDEDEDDHGACGCCRTDRYE